MLHWKSTGVAAMTRFLTILLPAFLLLGGAARAQSVKDPPALSLTYLNLLANVSNPIKSPETSNPPATNATYQAQAAVIGYAATAGSGTYYNQRTDNLTINGSVTNHWGEYESTINLLGTGTMNAELNDQKSYVVVPAGMTINASGENLESYITTGGTVSIWQSYTSGITNLSTGVITRFIGLQFSYNNQNTSGSTFFEAYGFDCQGNQGSGTNATFPFCIFNEDPLSDIVNYGHFAVRQNNTPTLSSCGGGSPSLSAPSSDVAGTITEGTTATGCTLTFARAYRTPIPTVIVTSPNGSTYSALSVTSNGFTITNSSASGDQFSYIVMGGN